MSNRHIHSFTFEGYITRMRKAAAHPSFRSTYMMDAPPSFRALPVLLGTYMTVRVTVRDIRVTQVEACWYV